MDYKTGDCEVKCASFLANVESNHDTSVLEEPTTDGPQNAV